MEKIRFEYNAGGIRQLLRSQGVRDHLMERGERVAAAARAQYREVGPVEVQDHTGNRRARVRIIALDARARLAEAEDRVLGKAIDAAR